MRRNRLSRRHAAQLIALTFGAVGVSYVLRQSAPLGRDVSHSPTARALLATKQGPIKGPPDADLTVVVFNDYQCPACRVASAALDEAFSADKNVRVVYREWPIFGPSSERAARVALAADGQGIYPEVHRGLMRASPPLDEQTLRSVVEQAGGRWDVLKRDLNTRQQAIDRTLAQTGVDAFFLELSGTPAYLIGNLLVTGALTAEEFGEAFELARAARNGNG